MKKCFYYMLIAILLAAVFSLTSCSNDEPGIDPVQEEFQNEAALDSGSNLVNLMQRIASKDGSKDNIVDGSSCLSIQFPYTVTLNGLQIIVDSIDDLQLIEDIFDEVDDDDDIFELEFPITITLADYSEVVVNDKEELRVLAAKCIEGGADEDIECIDFIYPMRLFYFDPELERLSSVLVNDDKDLRLFFAGLAPTDLVEVDYPISLELYDGTKETVNNNQELVDAIARAINTCDEDDDNDYGDDDFTKERLDGLLVECQWLVKELRRANESTTADYENYVLNFNDDGNVVAQDREDNVLYGKWSTKVSDYRVVLSLEFDFLTEFNLDWFVEDIDSDRVKLFTHDGDKIIMKQSCDEEPVGCDESFIKEVLGTCIWVPSQEENSELNELRLDFSNMNIHARNRNGEIVDEGNWNIQYNILVFNDLSMALDNYVGEWAVVECNIARFVLKRGDETLVLEKECE